MNTRHLVVLQGGGDTSIGFVTPEQWAWIHSSKRGKGSGWHESDPVGHHMVLITIGSAENDRAIHALFGTEGQLIERPTFETVRAALKYAKQQKWTVLKDEYHGCLY